VTTIDLGIAWEWEYDVDFVFELDRSCQRAGLTSYLVYPGNLMETWEKVQNGSLGFRVFLDRASDNVEAIGALVWNLKTKGVRFIKKE